MNATSHNKAQDHLNGGMHASIFVKVWGDAGGGDDGRIALAEYAFALGEKKKHAELDAVRAELAAVQAELAEVKAKLAAEVKIDVKAIHSAVLKIKLDPKESRERHFIFNCGIHRAAAVVAEFGFPKQPEVMYYGPNSEAHNG